MKHKIKHSSERNGKYKKAILFLIISVVLALLVLFIFNYNSISIQGEAINNCETDDKLVENLDEKLDQLAIDKTKEEIKKIESKVHEILGENESYYGICFCDLNTGLQYSLNGDKEFHAASTIKVPIAMMVGDKLYNNELSENTLIEYTSSDSAEGAGILQGEISEGDKKEVRELQKYMIEESDNIATAMLKRNVGNVSDYIYNITGIKANNENNFITPKQASEVLKTLYNKADENLYYEKIIEHMKETSTHDRLDKYIPRYQTAHKIGDYDKYVNDIGIIYTEQPYILAIYTKDVMEKGRENIALISKAIYEIKK